LSAGGLTVGSAQALGTGSLTFAANNTNYNPFNGSISTLPTYLYTFIASNFDTAVQRAWGAALVILILVAILFIAARLLTRQKTAKKAGK
jgi:phosphate transport system permease protein